METLHFQRRKRKAEGKDERREEKYTTPIITPPHGGTDKPRAQPMERMQR